MSIFDKIFKVNILEKKWYKIILWWELRRIPYNLLLILFLYVSLYILEILPQDGYVKIIAGPMLVVGTFLSIIFFFFFANICYSLGWLVQLVMRKIKHPIIKALISRLFIFGITISIIVTISPILLWIINLVVNIII